jgi:hypothetical protein
MSSVRGYDNIYSDSVNDIALLNYNKGIANRLRMQEDQSQQNLPFKEPKMLGGVFPSGGVLAGTTIESPATLAVGGGAFRRFTGNETALEGGNKFTDFAKKTGNISKKILKVGVPALSGAIGTIEGGPVVGLAAAKSSSALTDYLLGSGKRRGRKPKEGGKMSMKDLIKYGKVGVETASDMYDLYGKVKSKMGGKIKMKDVIDYGKIGVETVGDAINIGKKIKSKISGGGPIVDNIIDKVKSREGMVYSQSLKDALEKGIKGRKKPIGLKNPIVDGGCCGGARKGRFVKGSPEAKAFMASIRNKKK